MGTSLPPTLPAELWNTILLHAAGPPSFDAPGRTRQTTLARFALVSRFWRVLAKAELFRAPLLPSVTAAVRLARLLSDGKRGEELAGKVRELRAGRVWESMERDEEGLGYGIERLVDRCSGLRELHLCRLEGINLGRRLRSESLHTLHVCDCSIWLRPVPPSGEMTGRLDGVPYLPALRNLTLSQITGTYVGDPEPAGSDYWLNRYLLSGEVFPPRVRALNMDSKAVWDVLPRLQVERFRAGRGLLALAVPSFPEGVLDIGAITGCYDLPGLVLFSCPAEALRGKPYVAERHGVGAYLGGLPSSLRALRLTAGHFFGSDFLTPFLSSPSNRLRALEELILPLRVSTGAAFEGLRSWAGREGVRIVWERDEDGLGSMEDARWWAHVRRWEGPVALGRTGRRREERAAV
ncbi:hypothetical protein JCM8097_008950 [Rhodosporidiobolus ruineniae]